MGQVVMKASHVTGTSLLTWIHRSSRTSKDSAGHAQKDMLILLSMNANSAPLTHPRAFTGARVLVSQTDLIKANNWAQAAHQTDICIHRNRLEMFIDLGSRFSVVLLFQDHRHSAGAPFW